MSKRAEREWIAQQQAQQRATRRVALVCVGLPLLLFIIITIKGLL